MKVQAWIVTLTVTQEAKATEGTTLNPRIATISSTIDHLHEEFSKQGDQVQSSLTTEKDL